jgi:hypothetical protein
MTGRFALLLLVLSSAVGLAAEGEKPQIRQVWELKLAQLSSEPDRGAPDLLGLRFSPDGKWIAGITSRITVEGDRTELLLIPADGDAAKARRLQIRGAALSAPIHTGVHWSPSGQYLAVETTNFTTTIIRASDGERCDLPRTTVFGGFVGQDLAVAADWEPPKDPISIPADSSTVTIYDTGCRLKDRWKFPGQVREVEPSTRSGMIALSTEQSDIRIVTIDGQVRDSAPRSNGSMLRFAEKGAVLCKADPPARGTLACYELATGQRFSHPLVSGGAPFDVSLDSSIVVATHGYPAYSSRTNSGYPTLINWVIWDYRASREIGRLRYRGQRHAYAFSPCAVSPDGSHFLVGAGSKVVMYEISGR